jgi:hypothetical protein
LNTKRLEGFKDSTTISKKPGDDEKQHLFFFRAPGFFALFPLVDSFSSTGCASKGDQEPMFFT